MSSPTILLVEDDPSLRGMLETILRGEGFAVRACDTGEEAIELAGGDAFDLVIADIRMSGIDGLETIERLRSRDPELSSLVMTGYSSEEHCVRAIRLGVDDYLRKPFRLEDFLQAVHKVLAGSRRSREETEEQLKIARLLEWSLLGLLASARPSTPPGPFLEAGAAALARRARPPLDTAWMRVGAALDALQLAGLGLDSEEMPGRLRQLLTEEQDEETRLVRLLGRALAEGAWPESADAADAPLLEELRQPSPDGAAEIQAARRRSLVSLGQALVHARQLPQARQAFLGALHEETSREKTEALLGLAQVAARLDDRAPAADAREAAREALKLGPGWAVPYLVESALLLHHLGDDGWKAALERSSSLAEAEGDRALVALAEAVTAGTAAPERAVLTLSSEELLPTRLRALRSVTARAFELDTVGSAIASLVRRRPEFLTPETFSPAARWCLLQQLEAGRLPADPDLLRPLRSDPNAEIRMRAARLEGTAPATLPLRVYSLGPLEVNLGGELLPDAAFRTNRVKYLLARLALAGSGTSVHDDALMEDLWPERASAKKNLRWAVSVLRGLFRPRGVEGIVRATDGYALDPALELWHDVHRLELELSTAPQKDTVLRCDRILDLYRAPYLEACYLDWAVQRREALGARVTAWLEGALAVTRAQDAPRVLRLSSTILANDPCHQQACAAAMEACTRMGRAEEAVRLFESCKRALHLDLGLEPDTELIRLSLVARSLPGFGQEGSPSP